MGRFSRWTAYALQALLGLMFAFSATMKLTGGMDDVRDLLGVAPWFWSLAGICQAIGAVALLGSLRPARLAPIAVGGALWLAAVMVGAVITHIVAGDTLADMSTAIGLLGLLLLVAALRWRDARLGELLNGNGRRAAATQAVVR
jgi:putative oxidoreductase